MRSSQVSPIVSLSGVEVQKVVSEVLAAQRNLSDLNNPPPQLKRALALWQGFDITKLSKEKIDKKIDGTMALIHSYFAQIDPNGVYLPNLQIKSDFAEHVKSHSFAQDSFKTVKLLQEVMQSFCECAILISKQDKEKRENAFASFPPHKSEMACLSGTKERIDESIQAIRCSEKQELIISASNTAVGMAIDSLKYHVSQGNHIHSLSYLRYVLALESSRVIGAIDQSYKLPQNEIPSQMMWNILRQYPENFLERVNIDLSSDLNADFDRIKNLILEPHNQELLKYLADLNNGFDNKSFDEKKDREEINNLIVPLTYQDLIIIDEEGIYAVISGEKLDQQIREKLLGKMIRAEILLDVQEKSQENVTSKNLTHINAIRDYKVLISDEAKNHLVPLLRSQSPNDRLIAIEALWVMGGKVEDGGSPFYGASPFQFMKLLKELAAENIFTNEPTIISTQSSSSKTKTPENWFGHGHTLQDWFTGIRKKLGFEKIERIMDGSAPHSQSEDDMVYALLNSLHKRIPKEHQFKIERIAESYKLYKAVAKYNGFESGQDLHLTDLIKDTWPADIIIERIGIGLGIADLKKAEAKKLVVHPEKIRILEALKNEKAKLKTEFIGECIILAAKFNDTELCKYVIENFLNDEQKKNLSTEISTAFFSAVENGNEELVRLFIEKGVDINKTFPPLNDYDDDWRIGYTALMVAARFGHVNILNILLAAPDVNVDEFSYQGYTALMFAAIAGNEHAVNALLKRGADVFLLNDQKYTILMLAAMLGYEHVVGALLKHGADVSIRTEQGYNVLMLAAIQGDEKVVSALVKNGADTFARDELKKYDALMWAVVNGKVGAVKALLKAPNIDQNTYTVEGYSTLMEAIFLNYPDVVKELATPEVKIDYVCQKNGFTAVMLAADLGRDDSLKILLNRGANPNIINEKDGFSPLMKAVSKGNVGAVRLLLENGGVDTTIVGAGNMTALKLAKNPEIKNLLQPIQNLQNFIDSIPSAKGRILVSTRQVEGKIQPFLIAKNPQERVLSILEEASMSFVGRSIKGKQMMGALLSEKNEYGSKSSIAGMGINRDFSDSCFQNNPGFFGSLSTIVGRT